MDNYDSVFGKKIIKTHFCGLTFVLMLHAKSKLFFI